MNNELLSIWKEAIMAYFTIFSLHFTRETQNICKSIQLPG